MKLETAQYLAASYGFQLEVRPEQHGKRTFSALYLVKNGQEHRLMVMAGLQTRTKEEVRKRIEGLSREPRFARHEDKPKKVEEHKHENG